LKYRIIFLALVCLLVSSQKDSSNVGLKEVEISSIYKMVINRANTYNNTSVIVFKDLIVRPIDSNNLSIIKMGLKNYTTDIQESISDYNINTDSSIYVKNLNKVKRLSNTSKKYQLSKIGFSKNMLRAVLYEDDNIDSLLNHKSYLFLKKEGNTWIIESEILMNY
jgi:hypothetical protein